jgi:hypothetical protein
MDSKYRVTQLELEGIGAGLEIEEDYGAVPLSRGEILVMAEASKSALEAAGIAFEKALRWLEMYQSLLNSGWRWRVAAYVAWASMPKKKRWPQTQDELARDVLGLTSDRAITTWRKKNPAIDTLIGVLQGNAMLEARADAIDALVESASNESYRNNPDRRLLFQMTGDLVEKSAVSVNDGSRLKQDLRSVSDAELLAMSGEKAKEVLAMLRAQALDEAEDEPSE